MLEISNFTPGKSVYSVNEEADTFFTLTGNSILIPVISEFAMMH